MTIRNFLREARKSILEWNEIFIGCYGEDPKVGKEVDLGDLGRNKSGKIEA